MYRIFRIDGTELGVTDSVNYIKIGASGCFASASQEEAIGIAFNSIAYNLIGHKDIPDTDTVAICAVDGGSYMTPMSKTIEAEQAITELDISNIEAQQAITELELMILGG